jgi:hypothetical protein
VSAAGSTVIATLLMGDNQTGSAGEQLQGPVVLTVKTPDGRAVIGYRVSFHPSGNGQVTPAVGTTDAKGEVRTLWTLATSVGANTLGVAVPAGTTSLPFALTATGVAGAPAKLTVGPSYQGRYTGCNTMQCEARHLEGTSAVGFVTPTGAVYDLSGGNGPYALVTDRFDNPIAGVPIAWSTTGGAVVDPASAVTDATGKVHTRWVLNPAANGPVQTLTAAAGGITGSILVVISSPLPHFGLRQSSATISLGGAGGTTLPVEIVRARTNDTPVPADPEFLTVTSSDPAVASVEILPGFPARVRVTAHGQGTVTLTSTILSMTTTSTIVVGP